MLSDLDQTIRQLLIQAGSLDSSEYEVSFQVPDREWSAGISRPTLNCYLFDIRENRELRQHGLEQFAQNGRAVGRQRPVVFFDLTYLLTAWTREVEDEHRLLWYALQTLLRFERIPDTYLQGELIGGDLPIYARTAMPEGVLKSPGEFWTALDNQIKPSLSYVVTLPVDRDRLAVGPPVRTARVRARELQEFNDRWGWFGGFVRDADGQPLADATVRVEGRSVETRTDAEGRFRLRIPGPGTFVLVAQRGDHVQRRQVTVPEPFYDFSLGESAGPPATKPGRT